MRPAAVAGPDGPEHTPERENGRERIAPFPPVGSVAMRPMKLRLLRLRAEVGQNAVHQIRLLRRRPVLLEREAKEDDLL